MTTPRTASAARDPRVDPKPGDILRRGRQQRRVCIVGPFIKASVHGIHYVGSDKRVMHWIIPEGWKRWAATAEVIHAAE
jgi:hypothetical protein